MNLTKIFNILTLVQYVLPEIIKLFKKTTTEEHHQYEKTSQNPR